MTVLKSDVIKNFHAGNYPAVLTATIYSEYKQYGSEIVPFVISSLAAVGQHKEAELTLALKFEELTPDHLVFVYYHLAVANINSGRFQQAVSFIVKASRLRFLFEDNDSNFYLFMAFAYHRYACGKARQGLGFAYRAGGFLNRVASPYQLFLWLELMGNLSFLTGDTDNATDYTTEAAKAAVDIERVGSVRALTVSVALHLAKHSRDSSAAIARLEKIFADLGPLDVFMKASVCFELVRHNALIGRIDAAHKIYRQGLSHASRFASRRMDIIKLLRQIDIHLAEKNFHLCLPILESVDGHLLRDEDRVYLAEVLDKMTATYFSLSLTKKLNDTEQRLTALTRNSGIYVQRQQRTQMQATGLSATGNLNYRQIAFLAEMQPGQTSDVHSYRQRFGVSEITACRDLSQLTTEKYLLRIGKARATKYIKPDDQFLEIVRTHQHQQPIPPLVEDQPTFQ